MDSCRLLDSPKQLIAHLQRQLAQPPESTSRGQLCALIEQVLAADSLLDDCILVCGLLVHKHSLSSDVLLSSIAKREDARLRSLWMQVAIARARIQAKEAFDANVLFGLLHEAAASNDHVLMARGLECLQLLLASDHLWDDEFSSSEGDSRPCWNDTMQVLVEASLVPSDLVHYRIREIVKVLYSRTTSGASRLVETVRGCIREGCKLRYQLLAICQSCPPLSECSRAFAERALAPSVSECMQYADEGELVEWIARLTDGQVALLAAQYLLPRIDKGVLSHLRHHRRVHPIIRLRLMNGDAMEADYPFWEASLGHAEAAVRLGSLALLIAHLPKSTSLPRLLPLIRQAVFEAMLGGEAEFRQQFVAHFVDLLAVLASAPLKASSQPFVIDMFEGIILANLDHRRTPFPRLDLALRMTEAALPLFPQVERVVNCGLLIRCLRQSSFEAIRLLAFNLLRSLGHPVGALVPTAIGDLKRPRACHNEGAALLIELAFLQGSITLSTLIDELVACIEHSDNPNGLFIAIRRLYALAPITAGMHEDDAMTARLVHTILALLGSAESSTTHPTPEGLHLCHADDDDDDDSGGGGLLDDAQLSNQLVPLSWRMIREGSRLLAVIARRTGDRSLFDHLVSLMLRLRHPGAFSSLAEPLSMLASCFEIDVVADLVERQLGMKERMPSLGKMLGTSRRSAGLPLCLQALLVGQLSFSPLNTESGCHSNRSQNAKGQIETKHRFDHPQCRRTVEALLALLLSQGDTRKCIDGSEAMDEGEDGTIKVHALNCLRAITREARLAPFLTPLLPALLTACIAHMQQPAPQSTSPQGDAKKTPGSSNWSVRNSASMLFAVVTVRLFGSEHNRACVDERELERRCPGTVDCILALLLSPSPTTLTPTFTTSTTLAATTLAATDGIPLCDDENGRAKRRTCRAANASFPMLAIIRRIKPATLRCRQAFAAYARRVLGSDEIRVRRQAAIILAHTHDEPLLASGYEDRMTWNEVHGGMLLKPVPLASPLKSHPPPPIFASHDLTLLTCADLERYFERMKEHPLVSIARQAAVPQALALLLLCSESDAADALLQMLQRLLSVEDLFADLHLLASIIDAGLLLRVSNKTGSSTATVISIAERATDLCFFHPSDAIRHYSLALSLLRALALATREDGSRGLGCIAHGFASRLLHLPHSLHAASRLQLNEEIVALSLPLLLSSPFGRKGEELLLVDRYLDDKLCTDTLRTAACAALCQHLCSHPTSLSLLTTASPTKRSTALPATATTTMMIGMIERCLWDDCSDVRTQMATCLAHLLSLPQFDASAVDAPAMDNVENTSWSVPRAMLHFYRTFHAHLHTDQQRFDSYASDSELFNDQDGAEDDAEEASAAILFEAEPRNAFVDVGWRRLVLARARSLQASSAIACRIDAIRLN